MLLRWDDRKAGTNHLHLAYCIADKETALGQIAYCGHREMAIKVPLRTEWDTWMKPPEPCITCLRIQDHHQLRHELDDAHHQLMRSWIEKGVLQYVIAARSTGFVGREIDTFLLREIENASLRFLLDLIATGRDCDRIRHVFRVLGVTPNDARIVAREDTGSRVVLECATFGRGDSYQHPLRMYGLRGW